MLLVMPFAKYTCWLFPTLCASLSISAEVISSNISDLSDEPVPCVRYAHYFVDSNNPSREMAQTEQESSCNPFAESAFAKGIRQFTDQTGEWMSLTHCKHLGDYDPFNAEWSIKCGLIYMEVLERDNDYGDYCFNRQVAEAEYNGGAWVVWELGSIGNVSLDDAEGVCGVVELPNGRKRAMWACEENYDYIRNITQRQPKYLILGGKYCD